MKKLFLIRHAKSDWSNPFLDDFDRPLNDRGLKNAPFMGKLLKQKNIKPDLIISSSAKRTTRTAQIIAMEIGHINEILFDKDIYECEIETLESIVKNIDNKYENVFLVGHNPGLQEFVQMISDLDIENFPTCAIVEIEFKVDKWEDISKENSKIVSYEYPKKFKSDTF